MPDSSALDENSFQNARKADIVEVVLIKDQLCDLLTWIESLLNSLTNRFNQALT